MGAEPVAAVDHQDPLRDPLQVHRPVERGVTAAHQQDALSGEDRRVEDAVIQPPAAPVVRVLERQLARRERADPTGDEHGARRIGVPVGHHREAGRAVIRSAFEADDLLTEVHRSLPLQRLLRHAAHQVLGEDLRKSGNIEDVLLRIERRELAADLVERIDQATRGAAHPGVKGAEQSRRAGADDRDIFDVLHSPNRNGRQREKGEGSSERRRERVKIYTRTGDGGDTGLFGGGRVPKHDRRVEAYGQVDELNAAIGFALAQEPRTFCRELLETVQKDLFTIGAELATPDPEKLAKALGGPPLGRGVRGPVVTVRVPITEQRDASYDIRIGRGLLAELPELVGAACPAARYAVITDSHVGKLYGEQVVARLRDGALPAELFEFP